MSDPITPEDEARFWSYVLVTPDHWLWTGGRNKDGYGQFHWQRRNWGAHRFAWLLEHGALPPLLVVDHLCRNRSCVNPEHMELVTNGENVLRGVGPTAQAARATHCAQGHEFTPENTKRGWQGKRLCRICQARIDAGRAAKARARRAEARNGR